MSANIIRVYGDYKIQTIGGSSTDRRAITIDSGDWGSVNIIGNLNVSGNASAISTTSITTTNTDITDNIIFLNVGEEGDGITARDGQRQAGIEIVRGDRKNAQILFDENIAWDDRTRATSKNGLFVLKTNDDHISGIRLNYVDTAGGNLYLISNSGGPNTTGVISVTGTNNYEEQVLYYNNDHTITIPLASRNDDIIPNIKAVIDYVKNISAVGNVGITQNGGTLNIGLNKTVTISNTLTFVGAEDSTITLGAGGTVVYTRNDLSVFAATTSEQLAGVISDETGSGLLVFNNSPSLTTPSFSSIVNSGTLTLPTVSDTLVGRLTTDTFTNKTYDTAGTGNVFKVNGQTISAYTGTGSSVVLAAAPTITGHPTIEGVTSTGATGTNKFVFDTSPTLVTPDLGAATATTINKVTITAPATGSTLTIAEGKTLTVSNSVTFTSTDTSSIPSVAFGLGGTVTYTSNKLSAFSATTSAELAGVISDETGSGVLVFGTSPAITTSLTTGSTTFGLINATATTVNFAGAATSLNMGADTGTLTIGNPVITGTNATTFNMNGADPVIATSSTGTAGVFNTSITTGNLFGAATSVTIGATTGTLNLRNVTITAANATTFNMNGANPSIITSSTGTASIFNTNATTGNLFGAASAVSIGATTGTLNLRNVTITADNATTFNMNGANPSIITSATGTASIFNTNATTGNLFGAASAVSIGASTSTTTINDKLVVSGISTSPNFVSGLTNVTSASGTTTLTSTSKYYQNISGSLVQNYKLPDATTLTNGHTFVINNNNTAGNITVQYDDATSVGSVIPGANKIVTLYNNGTTNGSWDLHGFIPSNASWGSSSLDTNATTFSVLVAPTTMTFGYGGASTATLNVATGATASGNTKTINLGTGGAASSTTNINVGSTNGGTITFNSHVVLEGITSTGATGTGKIVFNTSPTISTSLITDSASIDLINTTATTINFAGAATALGIGAATGTLTIGNPVITGTNATTFNMNGVSPSIVTSSTGTASIFNTNATTGNLFGAATTGNLLGSATTTNLSLSGNVNIGSSSSATTTLNVGGLITGNEIKIKSTSNGTANLLSGVTTGTVNLFTGLTTGTMNIGSAAAGTSSLLFTTQSTSTTTGSFVTAGGIGVAKNLYLGGNATMIYQNSDPTKDNTGVILYSKNSNLSNTGLYFVNNTMSGELISKKKALAYSIVFG